MTSPRRISPESFCRIAVSCGFGFACLSSMQGGCSTPGSQDSSGAEKYATEPLAISVLNSLDASGEDRDPAFPSATDPTARDQNPPKTDYTIQKDDLLQISIGGLDATRSDETTKVVRVSDSGNISLPYIHSLHAAGLTEIELVEAITEAYRKTNQDVQVSIFE